eukprot:GHVQ01025930.1.p2 GENE.GHVQ01025930.1~~GHVQ01025930.1.p2  ORF type:complete len:165 (+),score=66.27 GHVQ01025930.1:1203-1697(+)
MNEQDREEAGDLEQEEGQQYEAEEVDEDEEEEEEEEEEDERRDRHERKDKIIQRKAKDFEKKNKHGMEGESKFGSNAESRMTGEKERKTGDRQTPTHDKHSLDPPRQRDGNTHKDYDKDTETECKEAEENIQLRKVVRKKQRELSDLRKRWWDRRLQQTKTQCK